MKKFICFMLPIALFWFNPVTSSAQSQGKDQARKGQDPSEALMVKAPSGMTVAFELEQLREALALTDEQLTRLREISVTSHARLQQAAARSYPTKAERQEAEKDLRTAQMAEIKKVLSEEQQVKFQQMLEKRQQKKEDHGS